MLRTEKNDMSESNLYILTHQDQCNFASFPGITSSPLTAFGLTPPTTKTPCNCTHLHTWLPCSVRLVCNDIDLSWHHQPQSKYYTTSLLFFWTWCDAIASSVDASDLKMQGGRRGNLDSACCVSFQFHYLSPSRPMNIYEYLYLYWCVYNEK